MARLDADLLVLVFRTAYYSNDQLNKEAREDLTTQTFEVAKSIEDLIDNRVYEILEERGISGQ